MLEQSEGQLGEHHFRQPRQRAPQTASIVTPFLLRSSSVVPPIASRRNNGGGTEEERR